MFRRFFPGSRGFIRVYLCTYGSFGLGWVHSGATKDLLVHSGWREFTPAHLAVVGFVLVRLGSLWREYGSSGSFVFARVYSGAQRGHWVHSCTRGFIGAGLGFVVFIRVRVGLLVRT